MNEKNDLTKGSVWNNLVMFALPYLLSCFMQTFYGMADLFVVGLYNGSETTTAVSIGSQVMHMLTVIIVGFAMGATVRIARCVGAKDERSAARTVGSAVVFFILFAGVLTATLLCMVNNITSVMMTPAEAVAQTRIYLAVCFAGIPFIVAYNVISSIFRGAGDSRRPMYFCSSSLCGEYCAGLCLYREHGAGGGRCRFRNGLRTGSKRGFCFGDAQKV